MKTQLKFHIQSLLEKRNGKISGPISPVLFAKDVTAVTGCKFNRLARVWFEDGRIFQQKDDDGLTGYDCLIIATQFTNDLWLTLWIDKGVSGLPVAMAFQSDRVTLLSSAYANAQFARKLTEQEIRQVIEHVFNAPEVLAIRNAEDSNRADK